MAWVAPGLQQTGSVASGEPIPAYIGTFRKGQKHGRGTEYDARGFKSYTGSFRSGRRHGHGISFEVRNDIVAGETAVAVYEGSFKDGLRHGYGVLNLSQGHRYEGSFANGTMAGAGGCLAICVTRSRFRGSCAFWLAIDAAGTYYHPNGDKFEGKFYGDKPDGEGSFYKVSLLEGTWHGFAPVPWNHHRWEAREASLECLS